VWEAIAIADRHPRVNILQPGPGVGGHCISVDPWFLVEAVPAQSPLIRTAREVNDSQPGFVVGSLHRILGGLEGKRIAVLGLTYKADVDDIRESPSLEIIHLLNQRGAQVVAFDPLAPAHTDLPCARAASAEEAAQDADCLLLAVAHQSLRTLSPSEVGARMRTPIAMDCANVWKREAWDEAGFVYYVLGDARSVPPL
jgi:UDP-N-acetyl-D-mannosaminuronic acid dehydrogenase